MVSKEVSGELVTLRVMGSLTGASVKELERQWRRSSVDKQCQVDLRLAHEIDSQGRDLISEMFICGVELMVGPHRPDRLQ